MSRFYRFVYAVGFTPWEWDAENVGPQLRSLLTREEADREPPYGSALDLGCGTGHWSVELAQRVWDVTGIDVVPRQCREHDAGLRNRASRHASIKADCQRRCTASIRGGTAWCAWMRHPAEHQA